MSQALQVYAVLKGATALGYALFLVWPWRAVE